nr:immunoglobulin heavy chain junction region [Mus musculus]
CAKHSSGYYYAMDYW